jgi:hypothetical protein
MPNRLARFTATFATLAGCIAGALGALPATPASAKPMSTKTFSYADMPDIDQKRAAGRDGAGVWHAGLPNNGIMYCGPAAAMNVLAFLADHGATEMSPGSHDWTAAANYDTMTSRLNELGGVMGTGATTGTSNGGLQNGLLAWSANKASAKHQFGLVSEFPNDDNSWQAPNLGIAAFTEAVGNPVIVSIGYYSPVIVQGAGNSEFIGLRRTGGHFVTMTGFDDSGFNFVDPADAAPSFAQSSYTNLAMPVTPVTAVYEDSKGNHYRSDNQTETYLHLQGYGAGDAYIEGYTVVQPSYTLTAKRGYLILRTAATTLRFKTPTPGLVKDLQLSPAGDSAYFAMTGGKTIYKLNLATQVSKPIAKTPVPVMSLAVSTKGDTVYAAAGRQLSAVSNTGAKIAQTTLPAPVAAITFDPVHGQVDAVTPQTKQVQVLAPSLAQAGTVTLPAAAVAKATSVSATVSPATGALTINAPGVASTVISAPQPQTTTADTTTVAPATSLANAPIIKVTPIASVKTVASSIQLHAAATGPAPTTIAPTAPGTIVRTPQTVLATGVWADQLNG